MTKFHFRAACFAVAATFSLTCIAQNPTATISNGTVHATLYLPDAKTGFYKGTRFDWSGIVSSLTYADHSYYAPWFQQARPDVVDYVYEGDNIVTGSSSAIYGIPEEFTNANHTALGWEDAKAGGTFIKIGVGVLRKPDDKPYSNYHLYEIVNGGVWKVTKTPTSVEFTQELTDPASGYAYVYRKRVSLTPGKSQLVIDHTLRNTGKRAIQSSVYDHNFMSMDNQPPGPDTTITLGFPATMVSPFETKLLQLHGNQISFSDTLSGQDKVAAQFTGFSQNPKDYDIRIEDRKLGFGVRATGNRPLSKVALWGIRTVISPEPFIDMSIAPGQEFTWKITYDYYTIPRETK